MDKTDEELLREIKIDPIFGVLHINECIEIGGDHAAAVMRLINKTRGYDQWNRPVTQDGEVIGDCY